MKIGVTGTREGATDHQLLAVIKFMESLGEGHEFHHGDCAGVDIQVAAVAKQLGWRIVCHPPKSTEMQGHFGGDEVRQPLGYLQRDRNIVDETEMLIVVPLQNEWQPKGGTWYTHDYAKKKNKPVTVFYPGETNEDRI
jgi:hypothetical protein